MVSSLVGERRLEAWVGGARAGWLTLKTQVLVKNGTPIYRLRDRLDVDLPGLGRASLRVEADVEADFSPLRVLLDSTEPRGPGAISQLRIELRREGPRWARYVAKGQGLPERVGFVELGDRPLVLTPPLGVGERLARLAGGSLGSRYSLGGYDLESGERTRWRLSADEEARVVVDGKPRSALLLRRREAGASLNTWREVLAGSAPLRVRGSRLEFRGRGVGPLAPKPTDDPRVNLCAWLRAACARDARALSRHTDLRALRAAIAPKLDAARFRRVTLARLTDESWLEAQGLLPLAAARPRDLEHALSSPTRARAWFKGAPKAVFVLTRVAATDPWKVADLPSR